MLLVVYKVWKYNIVNVLQYGSKTHFLHSVAGQLGKNTEERFILKEVGLL